MKRITMIKSIAVIGTLLLGSSLMAAEYHVSPSGSDTNNGTTQNPFCTIQHAADLAQPGDFITVHEGIYRERVNPPRGGASDRKRIVYQAAPGEQVEITGSEIVTNWVKVQDNTWTVTLPNQFFGAFNPYRNLIHGDWFNSNGRKHHAGAIYLHGDWLAEAAKQDEVLQPCGKTPLWFATVDATNTTLWAQFPGVNPNAERVEINVRQTVFTPSKTGINYLSVRGFTLRDAATPWAPPTAGQIGLISAYWCKGWIIENNEICYSTCCGVVLGKYGDKSDNTSANSASGYVKTIERALGYSLPWTKANIGSHIIRNNHIHHCEQAGIIGSLDGAFSTITGNEIHDIHIRRLFSGCEMAGIKLHGAIDTVIGHNHIYRCNRGIWLDWMAQGTRVTGNLFHNNAAASVNWPGNWEAGTPGGEQDMFIEVNHGPILVDNNIFLSPYSVNDRSQGVAFVHNFFAGAFRIVPHDDRKTPYLKPHSTEMVALHDNPCGDHRFFNNIFVERSDLTGFDAAQLPVTMAGNLYLKGAIPSKHEAHPLVLDKADPEFQLVQEPDGWHLKMVADESWAATKRPLVTTRLLGKTAISGVPFEQPDGSPLRLDTDYFGTKRDAKNPFPGSFETVPDGRQDLKVWPLAIPSHPF